MAENSEGSATELSFKVKTSGDGLHSITIMDSATVLDLKTKLSGPDYENVPVERMRLIYSGRVMKNEEPLATYKIKNGNTIHMVKSAASNPTPSNPSASSAPSQPAVPTNMSAGTSASNPLDNLTGARYAGFANLPSADLFGPNGGMGAPPSMDDVADMLSNPQAAQAMNEAMNNPAFIDMMIQNNPMLRNMPNAREMLQSQLPTIRHLMSDPAAMRSMLRVRAMLEGGGAMGSFPAPGATNTSDSNAAAPGQQQQQQQQQNPLAGLFGGNQFLNPFGAHPPPPYAPSRSGAGAATSNAGTPSATPGAGETNTTDSAGSAGSATSPQPQAGAAGAPPANPFAALFQRPGDGGGAAGAGGQPPPFFNPFAGADPEAMQNLLRSLGVGGGGPAPPADNRPPEERYADQLRQLNDMGFTDFDRNVTALRRSGGSVQGAIEFLLSG